MRWAFVFISWCLLQGTPTANDRLEPIKTCSLKRLSEPVLVSRPLCAESHCVDLGRSRAICKCLPQSDDQPSTLLYIQDDMVVQQWPAETYIGQTDDFHVLSGDLRADGHPLWIIANRELSSQGIGIHFWSLHVLDPVHPERPPISWSVSDFGPGSFARPQGRHRAGCDILVTDWIEGYDLRRGSGLYFVGTWFRLGLKDLENYPKRRSRLRRYLYSFESERAVSEDDAPQRYLGSPAQWLRPGKARPITSKIRLDEKAIGPRLKRIILK